MLKIDFIVTKKISEVKANCVTSVDISPIVVSYMMNRYKECEGMEVRNEERSDKR